MVAEVWERSVAIYEALQYVTYLYVEHANSTLTNNRGLQSSETEKSWSCKTFKA